MTELKESTRWELRDVNETVKKMDKGYERCERREDCINLRGRRAVRGSRYSVQNKDAERNKEGRRCGRWDEHAETKNISRSTNARFLFLVFSRAEKPTEGWTRGHKWKVPMDSSVFRETNILRLSPRIAGLDKRDFYFAKDLYISTLFRRLILTNARRWKRFLHWRPMLDFVFTDLGISVIKHNYFLWYEMT